MHMVPHREEEARRLPRMRARVSVDGCSSPELSGPADARSRGEFTGRGCRFGVWPFFIQGNQKQPLSDKKYCQVSAFLTKKKKKPAGRSIYHRYRGANQVTDYLRLNLSKRILQPCCFGVFFCTHLHFLMKRLDLSWSTGALLHSQTQVNKMMMLRFH